MQFFYHSCSGDENIKLDSGGYHYLFKVRRFKAGDMMEFRNLLDNKSYFYNHFKKDIFNLSHIIENNIIHTKDINIFLAIIDMKDIYNSLAFLNELNFHSIGLFYADFSQKNRSIDMLKANKILQHSSMQCGRFSMLEINIFDSLDSILDRHKGILALDFNDKISCASLKEHYIDGVVIGPEGGFSNREREMLKNRQISIPTPYILQSHNALKYVASLLSVY